MKVLDLFSGIGGFSLGLERAGMETVAFCEVDPVCRKVLKKHWKDVPCFEDVKTLTKEQLDKDGIGNIDVICGGFPCFPKGTLINTKDGYKNIENIGVGDKVLTHTNKYHKVLDVMKRKAVSGLEIKISGSEPIICTDEHPFYCFDQQKQSFHWVKAKDLSVSDKVCIPINKNSIPFKWEGIDKKLNQYRKIKINSLPLNKDIFWWFIGRYIADGYKYIQNKKASKGYRVVLTCGKHEINELEIKLENFLPYTKVEEPTSYKLIFCNQELYQFLIPFGRGAKNKTIPNKIIDTPKNTLKHLLEGYISGDGSKHLDIISCSTISKTLAYSLVQCIHKVYQKHPIVNLSKPEEKRLIEGRLVNQSRIYTINFSLKTKSKSFIHNGFMITSVKKIKQKKIDDYVYNFEVKNDNSYCVNNIVVHNCQNISVAGNRKGVVHGKESSLWKEFKRLIGDVRPSWVIIENVSALRGKGLITVLQDLWKIGYDAEWHCISASYVGAPHERDRIWIVGYPRGECQHQLFNGSGKERSEETSSERKIYSSNTSGDQLSLSNAGSQGLQGGECEIFNEGKIEKGLKSSLRSVTEFCPNDDGRTFWEFEPGVGRVVTRLPGRTHRLKQLGNAVVPQIPQAIGMAIMDYVKTNNNEKD